MARATSHERAGAAQGTRIFTIVALAGALAALAGCNRADEARDMAAVSPAHDVNTMAIAGTPPPLTAEPEIDPRQVFADAGSTKLPPTRGGSPAQQETYVRAVEAAAEAPDTASADAAKERVLSESASSASPGGDRGPATARDTPANNPRHGGLTQGEESQSMPKAGQVNNHSSTALEADSGRPSTGR